MKNITKNKTFWVIVDIIVKLFVTSPFTYGIILIIIEIINNNGNILTGRYILMGFYFLAVVTGFIYPKWLIKLVQIYLFMNALASPFWFIADAKENSNFDYEITDFIIWGLFVALLLAIIHFLELFVKRKYPKEKKES